MNNFEIKSSKVFIIISHCFRKFQSTYLGDDFLDFVIRFPSHDEQFRTLSEKMY